MESIGGSDSLTLEKVKEDIAQKVTALSHQVISRSNLLQDEINDETHIPEITPIVKIGGETFASKGDIAIIGGLPKVGKTSVCIYILATSLLENVPDGFDCLGIQTKWCGGKDIFYIDTEQPKAYTNTLRKNIKKVLGVEKQPANLHILNLRKYDSDTKRKKVFELMDAYPEAHLWIIDGVADLIKDPNDTKESFGVIEQFMMKSDELQTTVILHIHENPGTAGKLRGNLGSEAERKCNGSITIKKIKEKQIHCIEPKSMRGGDFEPIYFRYSKELGRMVSLDASEAQEVKKTTDRAAIRLQKLIDLAKICAGTQSVSYGDLVIGIINNSKKIEGKMVSKRTAQSRVTDMVSEDVLIKDGDFYRIADKNIPQP